jgi:hypothetical protein
MSLRPIVLLSIAALFAAPVLAADAINGATSGQRAIQSDGANGGRAISPPSQQRESAPPRLKDTPTGSSSGTSSTGTSSTGTSGTGSTGVQTRERFKSDSRSLSDKIERRRERFENGS